MSHRSRNSTELNSTYLYAPNATHWPHNLGFQPWHCFVCRACMKYTAVPKSIAWLQEVDKRNFLVVSSRLFWNVTKFYTKLFCNEYLAVCFIQLHNLASNRNMHTHIQVHNVVSNTNMCTHIQLHNLVSTTNMHTHFPVPQPVPQRFRWWQHSYHSWSVSMKANFLFQTSDKSSAILEMLKACSSLLSAWYQETLLARQKTEGHAGIQEMFHKMHPSIPVTKCFQACTPCFHLGGLNMCRTLTTHCPR